jgi:hypothetical protein
VDRGSDTAAPDRRRAGAMMSGDQQNDPVARVNRLLENIVDRTPRGVERHPVQVERPVRLGRARAEPPVPARVEGVPM